VPREVAGEQDQDYPDFARLAAAYLPPASPLAVPVSDADLARAADALYQVFAAATEDAAARAVNDVLAGGAQQPRLGLDGGRLGERWVTAAAEQLLAACMLTLYRQLIQWGDSRRLGLCRATRCLDVYVDLSPTGQRRFCSVNCRDRNRVAAFRARHKRLRESAT
jgi:predicted RNA-binding Zn ribbon-like protein